MAKKIAQPALSPAEIDILKERIRNMNTEEQKIVATELDSSVLFDELKFRHIEMGIAVHEAAEDLRRVQRAWLK